MMSLPDGPYRESCRFGLATPACPAGHSPCSSVGVGSAFQDSLKNNGGRGGPSPPARLPRPGEGVWAKALDVRAHTTSAVATSTRRAMAVLRNRCRSDSAASSYTTAGWLASAPMNPSLEGPCGEFQYGPALFARHRERPDHPGRSRVLTGPEDK